MIEVSTSSFAKSPQIFSPFNYYGFRSASLQSKLISSSKTSFAMEAFPTFTYQRGMAWQRNNFALEVNFCRVRKTDMVKLSVQQREETSVLVKGWHTIRDNSYDSLIPVSESILSSTASSLSYPSSSINGFTILTTGECAA